MTTRIDALRIERAHRGVMDAAPRARLVADGAIAVRDADTWEDPA